MRRRAWVVPAGVTSAVFDLHGAAGGSLGVVHNAPGGFGGKGARVQATVALTPGATLNMRVGGVGQDGAGFPDGDYTATVTGGFNGGGTNSANCFAQALCAFGLGGAGGGSTDVRTSADGLADRLLVAGGGGWCGQRRLPSDPGTGGASATTAKTVSGGPITVTCSGGGAGTLLGPGAAGSGMSCGSGSPGAAGGLNGGGSVDVFGVGAGGGGYFGGGAGARGFDVDSLIASGGGGGSDYPQSAEPAPAGVSNVTITDGFQSGNGAIIVTYTTPITITTAIRDAAQNDITGKTVVFPTVMHDEATVAKAAGTPASAPDPTGTVSFTLYATLTCNGDLVPGEYRSTSLCRAARRNRAS